MALRSDIPLTCPVLIGRSREQTALATLLAAPPDGQGSAAPVSGEAGIGKSRLLATAKSKRVPSSLPSDTC